MRAFYADADAGGRDTCAHRTALQAAGRGARGTDSVERTAASHAGRKALRRPARSDGQVIAVGDLAPVVACPMTPCLKRESCVLAGTGG